MTTRTAAPDVATRPRLSRVRREGTHREVAAAFLRLALDPAAAPVAPALRLAAQRLPPRPRPAGRVSPPVNGPLPALGGPLTVDVGLRPLLGELGLEALETGRPDHAVTLLSALAALAPESPAGPLALAAVWLAVGRPEDAVSAASEAVSRAPADPAAKAGLAEALLFSGRRQAAERAASAARAAPGAAGRWSRGLLALHEAVGTPMEPTR